MIQFDNRTPADVAVSDAQLVIRGQRTGYVIDETAAYDLTLPDRLPADDYSEVYMEVHRDTFYPDKYSGTLRLKVEDLDNPVTANVTMDVRDPPLWPFVVLVAGVVVGRLSIASNTPAGSRKLKFLEFIIGVQEPTSAPEAQQPTPPLRRWLRVILSLLLLVLLPLLGWYQLYITNGANFGVNGLLDYLGLFLWGMSATVVQSGLHGLYSLRA